MEESKKKTLMIVVIVACLVAAVLITVKTRSSGGGVPNEFAGKILWLKCTDKACGHSYEMDMKEYFQTLKDRTSAAGETTPIECPECGKESIGKAVKCEECGLIFLEFSVPRDFPDRCPKCGFSKQEEQRKRALEK